MQILLLLVGLASLFGAMRLSALSANRQLDRYVDAETRLLPVKSGAHIYQGALVGITAGYIRPLTAGDAFAGVAYEECDNTSGSDGTLSVKVWVQGDFEHALTSSSAANNGAPVYASADDTVTLTGPGNTPVGFQVAKPATNMIVLRLRTIFSFAGPNVAAPAAAGSSQADGVALVSEVNFVSGADATKGAILPPTPVVGRRVRVINTAAAVLKVYPATGGTINALSANAAISMAANTSADFEASSTTQWYTTPRVPS